jgi:hypothetical protein
VTSAPAVTPPPSPRSPGTSPAPSAWATPRSSSPTPPGCSTTSDTSRFPTASPSATARWPPRTGHPAIGADLLRDLGVYGPVAEIVKAHHERPDGRGYPEGLTADQIPEIAKIIAVAEVYDTLTAKDTYRVRHGSFEAIRELRRVAGTQLDERYVEVLSELLSGEGLEYRHADQASFDVELDMPRRVREATGGPSI